MIKHIVCWKVKPEERKDLVKEFEKRLMSLPPVISEIKDFEVGVNINKSDAAYDVVLYSSFDSIDDLKTYQGHTKHQEVADFIKANTTQRVVVDYQI
jgi:hypothetical protein